MLRCRGYCTSAWSGVACINPFANPLTKGIGASHPMTASADEWTAARSYWCSYGLYLHYILLGWAGFFTMELVIRYVGHQGAFNFFTAKSTYVKKFPDEPVPKSFEPKTIPNIPNILDTICILTTVAGILLTEFTMGVQVLNANISLMKASGEEDWSFFTATGPRQIKFLRLAAVIRYLACGCSSAAGCPAARSLACAHARAATCGRALGASDKSLRPTAHAPGA